MHKLIICRRISQKGIAINRIVSSAALYNVGAYTGDNNIRERKKIKVGGAGDGLFLESRAREEATTAARAGRKKGKRRRETSGTEEERARTKTRKHARGSALYPAAMIIPACVTSKCRRATTVLSCLQRRRRRRPPGAFLTVGWRTMRESPWRALAPLLFHIRGRNESVPVLGSSLRRGLCTSMQVGPRFAGCNRALCGLSDGAPPP